MLDNPEKTGAQELTQPSGRPRIKRGRCLREINLIGGQLTSEYFKVIAILPFVRPLNHQLLIVNFWIWETL